MKNISVPAFRLQQHNISQHSYNTAEMLVSYMGAVQAQDFPMSKWAIGLRLPNATDASIQSALDAGEIVRTHVLRPTWHIVAGRDVRWMLALTSKRIKTAAASYSKDLGLDTALYNKANDVIAKALEGGKNLTREELATELTIRGISMNASLAALFMMNAETDALVCNGAMRGKEQTYALLDEKVPNGKVLSHEEALAELAKRYFVSHAPATIHDFHWWSGLSMSDARAALASIEANLQSYKVDDRTYFSPKDMSSKLHHETSSDNSVFFLPAFDEYCVSYKDRTLVFQAQWHSQAITKNGIFKPLVVINGMVEGIWKRTVQKKQIDVELKLFDVKSKILSTLEADNSLQHVMERFATFTGQAVFVRNS